MKNDILKIISVVKPWRENTQNGSFKDSDVERSYLRGARLAEAMRFILPRSLLRRLPCGNQRFQLLVMKPA
jgi:hypothetical protein